MKGMDRRGDIQKRGRVCDGLYNKGREDERKDKKNGDRAENRFKSFYHEVNRGKLLR